jgi:hypothetical protein
MSGRRIPRLTLAAACCGLAACGSDAPAVHCTPPPTPSPPSVVAGPLTASADHAVLAAGAMLKVSVDAGGPLSYQAPCTSPVTLLVVDSADIHVDSVSPVAPKGTPCGAVTLAAGQTAHYEVIWTADPTLPPGRYRVVVALGDQAPIALPIELGLGSLTCG